MTYWKPKTQVLQEQIDQEEAGIRVVEQQPWWSKGLEYALLPWTSIGKGVREITGGFKAPSVPTMRELVEKPQGYEQKLEELVRYAATQGKEYQQLPAWKQMLYELPAYVGTAGITATGIRGALAGGAAKGGAKAIAPKVARAVLKPAEVIEQAPGKLIGKAIGKIVPKKVTPVTPEVTKQPLSEIDATLNKFGETIASPKMTQAFKAQQELWAQERTVRSAKFAELLEKERASGVDARTAIQKATVAFKGLYPREPTGLIIPKEAEDAAYSKIIKVITEDNSIPPALKSFEIASTKTALDNALAGRQIPNIPGIKGGSALTRLLKIFQDNPIIKDIIKNPEETQRRLLERMSAPEELDAVTTKYLMNIPSTAKQISLAMLPPSARQKVLNTLKTMGLNVVDAIGIPKAVKFAFDFSYMFRQLGISGTRHPISWLKTWKPYFQAMRSEKIAIKLDNIIRTDPQRMEAIAKLGLDPYDITTKATYWTRPETMASKIAEKYIPGVRMSNRGAAVALNYFLTDVGKNTLKVMQKMGAKEEEYKAMGSLFNELVGRGEMPRVLKGTMGDVLNKLLSSPRYLASRFEWPTKLLSSSKIVRQEAWSTLIAWAGVGSGILGMAKISGLADIEGDPRSSEAMKLRIGNKRIDIWAGYAQIIRLAAQLAPYVDKNGKVDWAMGSRKTESGQIIPVNRGQLITRFAQSKESPGIGAIVSILTGKNYVGEKIDLSTWKGIGIFAKETFSPASFEEMADAYALEGLPSAALSGIGLGGIGVSTYESQIGGRKAPPKRKIR